MKCKDRKTQSKCENNNMYNKSDEYCHWIKDKEKCIIRDCNISSEELCKNRDDCIFLDGEDNKKNNCIVNPNKIRKLNSNDNHYLKDETNNKFYLNPSILKNDESNCNNNNNYTFYDRINNNCKLNCSKIVSESECNLNKNCDFNYKTYKCDNKKVKPASGKQPEPRSYQLCKPSFVIKEDATKKTFTIKENNKSTPADLLNSCIYGEKPNNKGLMFISETKNDHDKEEINQSGILYDKPLHGHYKALTMKYPILLRTIYGILLIIIISLKFNIIEKIFPYNPGPFVASMFPNPLYDGPGSEGPEQDGGSLNSEQIATIIFYILWVAFLYLGVISKIVFNRSTSAVNMTLYFVLTLLGLWLYTKLNNEISKLFHRIARLFTRNGARQRQVYDDDDDGSTSSAIYEDDNDGDGSGSRDIYDGHTPPPPPPPGPATPPPVATLPPPVAAEPVAPVAPETVAPVAPETVATPAIPTRSTAERITKPDDDVLGLIQIVNDNTNVTYRNEAYVRKSIKMKEVGNIEEGRKHEDTGITLYKAQESAACGPISVINLLQNMYGREILTSSSCDMPLDDSDETLVTSYLLNLLFENKEKPTKDGNFINVTARSRYSKPFDFISREGGGNHWVAWIVKGNDPNKKLIKIDPNSKENTRSMRMVTKKKGHIREFSYKDGINLLKMSTAHGSTGGGGGHFVGGLIILRKTTDSHKWNGKPLNDIHEDLPKKLEEIINYYTPGNIDVGKASYELSLIRPTPQDQVPSTPGGGGKRKRHKSFKKKKNKRKKTQKKVKL